MTNINYSFLIGFMIIEILRSKIRACGKTQYRISADTGIDKAALCRIMQGKSCRVETADKLFKYFGLEVVEKKKDR